MSSDAAGRARLLAQERDAARDQVEWMKVSASAQLAENALAVTRLQAQVQSLQSSLVSDADHRQGAWERRVARLETQWARAHEQLRSDCSARLAEADEVLALREEEGAVAAEENRLLGERLSHAAREVEARDDEVRRLLERALQAEFDAHATAAEAEARVAEAEGVAAAARRRARAPRRSARWRWRRSARSTARRATSTWSATSGRARRSARLRC